MLGSARLTALRTMKTTQVEPSERASHQGPWMASGSHFPSRRMGMAGRLGAASPIIFSLPQIQEEEGEDLKTWTHPHSPSPQPFLL